MNFIRIVKIDLHIISYFVFDTEKNEYYVLSDNISLLFLIIKAIFKESSNYQIIINSLINFLFLVLVM